MIRIFTHYTFVFYYGLLLWGLLLLDWSTISIPVAILLFLLASFFADLLSGIWHMIEDFYPLNYKKGLDKMFYYKGSRGSPEFLALKKEVFPKATLIEKIAYNAKVHHRKPTIIYNSSYNDTFLDHALFAFLFIGIALGAVFFGHSQEKILFLFFISFFLANTEFVHVCVHKAPQFPWGGRFIALMQSMKLVYSSETHKAHHQGKGTGFCFITGHANFVVNPLCRLLLKYEIITMNAWKGRQQLHKKSSSND